MQKIDLPIEKDEATPTNPDFGWWFKMLVIFVWFFIFSYLVFFIFSNVVLKNLSLETEKEWFWDMAEWEKFDYEKYSDYKIDEFKNYNFNLNYDEEINAYAFIWGNININQGFLDSIENQEELVFVMAHEMIHVKNRDVLKALSTQIPMQLTFAILGFNIDLASTSILDIWWNFLSKDTELKADNWAIQILEKYKINPLCAKKFFTRDHNFWDSVMEMMSDHPLNLTRIKLLEESAKKMWFTDENNCKKLKNIIK